MFLLLIIAWNWVTWHSKGQSILRAKTDNLWEWRRPVRSPGLNICWETSPLWNTRFSIIEGFISSSVHIIFIISATPSHCPLPVYSWYRNSPQLAWHNYKKTAKYTELTNSLVIKNFTNCDMHKYTMPCMFTQCAL